jgi:hypothetical protein
MVQPNTFIMKTIIATLLIAIFFSQGLANEPSIRISEILKSGDGKTPETAYIVYSIDEEYRLLTYLGMKPEMQMLSVFEGQYYDILVVEENHIFFKLVRKPSNTLNPIF